MTNMLTTEELLWLDIAVKELEVKGKDPTPGLHDTSPLGTGKNWVTGVGGLPLYIREIAHALIRSGHTESNAIQLALGTVQRWARGQGGVTPKTRAKAAAAYAEWLRKRVQNRLKHAASDSSKNNNDGKKSLPWDTDSTKSKEISMEGLEYKAANFAGDLNVVDEDQGIVETIISVTGMVDNVKDNIMPGVYAKALAERTPKGIWSHDWNRPVSKTLAIKELLPGDSELPKTLRNGDPWPDTAGALKVKTQFNLATDDGRNAFQCAKFYGPDQEWSIGYQVPPGGSKMDQKSGVRIIEAINLYEYSQVLFGAMPQAVTQSVKMDSLAADHKAIFGRDDDGDYISGETKKAFSDSKRKDLAKTGIALPDGSFPVENEEDLHNAISAYGRASDPDAAKAHIKKRAKAMGKTSALPESWQDGDSATKALDTTPDDSADYTDTVDDSANSADTSPVNIDPDNLNILFELIDHLRDFAAAITGQGDDEDDDNDGGDQDAVDEDDMVTKAFKPKDQKKASAPHKMTGDDPKSCATCGSGPDNWRHKMAGKSVTLENDSLADLIGNLADSRDDIENYDTLASLAHQFDAATNEGDKSLALDISKDFLNELATAMDDSSEDDTSSIIGDIAESLGEMLQSMGDGVHVPDAGGKEEETEEPKAEADPNVDPADVPDGAETDLGDAGGLDGKSDDSFVITKDMLAELQNVLNN